MVKTPVIHSQRAGDNMRTSVYDNSQNVFEVQTALRKLRETHKIIPLITPDGVFGPETTEAVLSAQEFFSLPRTGEVDFDTWEVLFDYYFNS